MNPVHRGLWMGAGFVALGAGMAGAVLPLVPTTPFILLAAFAFARSSKRWHDWLLAHNVFGPLIHNWNQHGAISRRAKILSGISMVAVFAISLMLGASSLVLICQSVILSASAMFVFTRPDPPPIAPES
ncbi:MAG: YbaN family protein [Pseudomonadota bacterium]